MSEGPHARGALATAPHGEENHVIVSSKDQPSCRNAPVRVDSNARVRGAARIDMGGPLVDAARVWRGFLVILGEDGGVGTVGAWKPNGIFEPLLEGVGWPMVSNGVLTAVAEREGDVGALVALDLGTLETELRAEDVSWRTVRTATQAPALGSIRDWDEELGAGTFEVWVQPTGQKIVVDEGVSDYGEMFWPRPGAVYAVRTPGREGLWTAYPDL